MALPASFARDGFLGSESLRPKLRRLFIGIDGPPDTGKTEFALSAPGPGIAVCLDRGMDPVFDNPKPPSTRQKDWGFKVISAPKETAAKKEEFLDYWQGYKQAIYKAAQNPDCRSILMDGDSDSWELQRLAAFGTLTQIPAILYTQVNAARRAFYAKLWDSGKIVIGTNKIKKTYSAKLNPDGTPFMKDGKEVREWDGKSYDRQGFDDQEYLWQIQLTSFYDQDSGQWGVRIKKCKADMSLVGFELVGSDCNFASLVQTIYPQVPLKEWGYK